MTFSALDWMRGVRDARWPSPAKAVAHALALRADEFGNAWPSIDQLALDAGLGRTAAKAALASLRRVNAVTVDSGSKGRVVNRYQLQPVASWLVEEPQPVVSQPVEPVASRPVAKQPVARRPSTGRLTTSNRSPDDQDLPKNCPRTAHGEKAPAPAQSARRPPDKPELMRADWQPPESVVAAQATRWQATRDQLLRTVPEFRDYWIRDGKRRNANGWIRTWTNRLEQLGGSGKLWVEDLRSNVRGAVPPGREHHEQMQSEQAAWKARQLFAAAGKAQG